MVFWSFTVAFLTGSLGRDLTGFASHFALLWSSVIAKLLIWLWLGHWSPPANSTLPLQSALTCGCNFSHTLSPPHPPHPPTDHLIDKTCDTQPIMGMNCLPWNGRSLLLHVMQWRSVDNIYINTLQVVYILHTKILLSLKTHLYLHDYTDCTLHLSYEQ